MMEMKKIFITGISFLPLTYTVTAVVYSTCNKDNDRNLIGY
jgi:hypothetical protein